MLRSQPPIRSSPAVAVLAARPIPTPALQKSATTARPAQALLNHLVAIIAADCHTRLAEVTNVGELRRVRVYAKRGATIRAQSPDRNPFVTFIIANRNFDHHQCRELLARNRRGH
jgi:hypothetical protein